MVFLDPQDTPEVAIIVNKPATPKILNEIKLQEPDLLVIDRMQNFIRNPMQQTICLYLALF